MDLCCYRCRFTTVNTQDNSIKCIVDLIGNIVIIYGLLEFVSRVSNWDFGAKDLLSS